MSWDEMMGLVRWYAERHGLTEQEAIKAMTEEMKNAPRERDAEKLSLETF